MKRIGVIITVLLTSHCSRSEPVSAAPKPATPPNILLVLVDDLGWSDLGCYGNPAVDTPRIDAFCAQGVRFTDAYAAAPVCSPTRASIMTGLAPARMHITNHLPDRESFTPDNPTLTAAHCEDRLALEYVTVAEHLQRNNYKTAFFGKWHLAPQRTADQADFYPDAQGFDRNTGGNGWGGPGSSFFAPYEFPGLVSKEENEYLPYRLGEEVQSYIRQHAERETDEPFFVALWNYTVHWPMDSPPDLLAKYQERGVQPGIVDPRYAGMTEALDQVIGGVLDALKETGLDENTLVIFSSDNGALASVADNRPLRGSKGYLYEAGIRVPTMVRWPGKVRPGRVDATPIISTDWFSTILDAAGVELPADYPGDGMSLVSLLDESEELEREALYFHYPNYAWHRSNRLGSAIRAGDMKLIERFDDGSLELYDLEADRAEENNLAQQRPELAQKMQRSLLLWRASVSAALPDPVR
ncbi:MAG: arylsulfatase A [Planctomycetota bacterium]|jgi:arylsulfatase A